MQVFINDLRFIYVVPLRSKGEAPFALRSFFDAIGLPKEIVMLGKKHHRDGVV